MSYYGDDWIFFKRAFLSYNGNTKEIFFNEYDDKKTENSGGGVWEWIDVSISSEIEKYLQEFAKSKNAKMRLSGKYTRTRNLTWKERQGILDVLNGYDVLKKDQLLKVKRKMWIMSKNRKEKLTCFFPLKSFRIG
ncbi:MAG TPA: hypothetical protein ENH26_01780 [Candidatus Wolfebacteria bacterium]|nr:hypothetical protein [Candidatus Wolfebacteria bacterium]